MALERTAAHPLLIALGEELAGGEPLELTVVGGGGLGGRELDVLGPLPERLAAVHWLQEAPAGFQPRSGFEERLEVRHYGPLTVRVASRLDQIHFELFAGHDEHLSALAPTAAELSTLSP